MSITLAAAAQALTLTFGIHLGSAHLPAKPGQNNLNPGVYVTDVDSGWQAGAYFNTYERPTLYAGKHWEVLPHTTVFLAAATGYDRSCWNVGDRITTERRVLPSGATVTATTHAPAPRKCTGWSRTPIAPVMALTWAPEWASGARLWLSPGIAGASTVVHVSWEFTAK